MSRIERHAPSRMLLGGALSNRTAQLEVGSGAGAHEQHRHLRGRRVYQRRAAWHDGTLSQPQVILKEKVRGMIMDSAGEPWREHTVNGVSFVQIAAGIYEHAHCPLVAAADSFVQCRKAELIGGVHANRPRLFQEELELFYLAAVCGTPNLRKPSAALLICCTPSHIMIFNGKKRKCQHRSTKLLVYREASRTRWPMSPPRVAWP